MKENISLHLKQYKIQLNSLRRLCAKQLNVNDEDIDDVLHQCFDEIKLSEKKPYSYRKKKILKYSYLSIKFVTLVLCLMIVLYILLNVHQTTYSFVLRNVQLFIYPSFKFVRVLSMPFIHVMPQLTNFYDENCLLENPYFYVADMECTPCQGVHSVLNLTGLYNQSMHEIGSPYIVKNTQQTMTFKTLKKFYRTNKLVLDSTANTVKSSDSNIKSLKNLFQLNDVAINSQTLWRFNKMLPNRLLRSLFLRPKILSERVGMSIERYLMIDGPLASSYSHPTLECSYVFVIQTSGERAIVFKPSMECHQLCKTVSIILRTGYVCYNWWYWRPISLPVENSTETSIAYISSHC